LTLSVVLAQCLSYTAKKIAGLEYWVQFVIQLYAGECMPNADRAFR